MEKKSSKINIWLSMGANFAVLIGLILVAIQIKQNTSSFQGAAYQTWVAANIDLNMTLTDVNLSKIITTGHIDPTNLTEDNYIAYSMWVLSFMQMVQATDYLYREGAIDKNLWTIEIQRAAAHLTSPGVRQWWDAGGRTQLSPEFVKLVESTKMEITGWGWDPERGFVSLPKPKSGK